jgi:dihydroorotate dehydrogenase (NAD+) catalytic subunit
VTSDIALPRYNYRESYDWNYDHAPEPVGIEVPAVPGDWEFFGRRISSPLGMAAGPLLNGRWILYYASLGYDVLTYKTVRRAARACYPMPNLQPVNAPRITGCEPAPASPQMDGSWAVSFGMPSRGPEIWRADVEKTRARLAADKVLSVSVVASPQPGWSLSQLAEDYAVIAQWAVASGADCIEANFSCPNVQSVDGQLYQQPGAGAVVAERIRDKIGSVPLLIKIGHVTRTELAAQLISELALFADGLVMINCIAADVIAPSGEKMFQGEKRGIAGQAIRQPVLDQIQIFNRLIKVAGSKLKLIGVGGISTAQDVEAHLQAGSSSVQLATAAMLNPGLGIEIRRQLQHRSV